MRYQLCLFLSILVFVNTAFATTPRVAPKAAIEEDPYAEAEYEEAVKQEMAKEVAASECAIPLAPQIELKDLGLERAQQVALASLDESELQKIENVREREMLRYAIDKGVFKNWETPIVGGYVLAGKTPLVKISNEDAFGQIRFLLGGTEYVVTLKNLAEVSPYRGSVPQAETSAVTKVEAPKPSRLRKFMKRAVLATSLAIAAPLTISHFHHSATMPSAVEHFPQFESKWRAASEAKQREMFIESVQEFYKGRENRDLESWPEYQAFLDFTLKGMRVEQFAKLYEPFNKTDASSTILLARAYVQRNISNVDLIFAAAAQSTAPVMAMYVDLQPQIDYPTLKRALEMEAKIKRSNASASVHAIFRNYSEKTKLANLTLDQAFELYPIVGDSPLVEFALLKPEQVDYAQCLKIIEKINVDSSRRVASWYLTPHLSDLSLDQFLKLNAFARDDGILLDYLVKNSASLDETSIRRIYLSAMKAETKDRIIQISGPLKHR